MEGGVGRQVHKCVMCGKVMGKRAAKWHGKMWEHPSKCRVCVCVAGMVVCNPKVCVMWATCCSGVARCARRYKQMKRQEMNEPVLYGVGGVW